MPIHELTESDLKAYHNKLSKPSLPSAASLSELSLLYAKFEINERNLIELEYGLDRIRVENTYAEEKQQYQARLNELKRQYKQVDNRIISVEQKLSRGIPEDMALVEKLITEQESIVEEQERLNNTEAELATYKSAMDIAYGKMREKLEQNQIKQSNPLKSRFDNHITQLNQADHQIKNKTRLYALLVIIGIPLVFEFIVLKTGIPVAASKAAQHLVLAHYIFILALVATELYLAERIRNIIYSFFAARYAKASFAELSEQFKKNLDNRSALEKNSGLTARQVKELIP